MGGHGNRRHSGAHTVGVPLHHDCDGVSLVPCAQIYNAKTRAIVKEVRRHAGLVYTIAVDRIGATPVVFSGSADFTVCQFSAKGKFLRLFAGHSGGVRCLLPLGGRLYSGADDKHIRVWDTATAECMGIVDGVHSASVLALVAAYTRGQPCVWSGGEDGVIQAWSLAGDKATGRLLVPIHAVNVGHRVSGLSLMGPDEMWVSGQDKHLRVLHTNTMAEKKVLKGHDSYITR